ncbi:MAG: glycosyltransferase family 2 protein [Granulosicoccus sp.]|nr:glycosyltransferase family 2 protein [Granulosicoccus sp.]
MTSLFTRLALKLLAGSSIPPHWLYPPVLPRQARRSKTGRLSIEIVSHCWQYAHLLSFQLDSLLRYPIHSADVTMTVFFSQDDEATCQLLARTEQQSIDNVTWNWQVLPSNELFRRSIGRNRAALSTKADWVWFTDCDMTFQAGCLDSLNAALQGRLEALVYPALEGRTGMHTDSGQVNVNTQTTDQFQYVDPDLFKYHPVSRATGPLQITHGDVARANGYCRDVAFYQKPADRFQKATEDRMFRWLLNTQGTAIDVKGACRIQHAEKGRYKDGSAVSRWRKRIRRWQYTWRQRSRP